MIGWTCHCGKTNPPNKYRCSYCKQERHSRAPRDPRCKPVPLCELVVCAFCARQPLGGVVV